MAGPKTGSLLNAAFKASLKTFAQAATLAVDWGDEKEYRPSRAQWLRPRLNPAPTKPGPSNAGPLRGELRGIYSVECFTPIESGQDAAFLLADNVADHFLPDWLEPGYVTDPAGEVKIHIYAPSINRLQSDEQYNRAVAHIPYLVYVIA